MSKIVLASGSEIRAQLLRNAGVCFDVAPARVDEDAFRGAMCASAASARDIADGLAEMKAQKISAKRPDDLVIGCDQVLNFQGQLITKADNPDTAITQLRQMRGQRHELLSAAVICEHGKPIWRHVGVVRLMMRSVSDDYLEAYVQRNWTSIRHSVGAYKLEEEGVRLFSQIQGDYFTVLGLPLLELLSYLTLRGDLDG